MNTVNNRRRRESVERIERAFMELLQEKEPEKISVAELCQMAELNRSTFYANFADVYDLAEKVRVRLVEEFMALYRDEFSQGVSTGDFLKLFRHIKENPIFYRTYFKLGEVDASVIGFDRKQAERAFGGELVDYHVEFFKSGLNAVIKKWLADGCVQSPEKMESVLKSEYYGRGL